MFAKIAVLCLCVAVAYAGVVGVASPPASTTLLANHQVLISQPAYAQVAAVRSVVAAPAATYLAAPQYHQIVASPQVIQTGTKIVQTHEPVEQHGYKIVY